MLKGKKNKKKTPNCGAAAQNLFQAMTHFGTTGTIYIAPASSTRLQAHFSKKSLTADVSHKNEWLLAFEILAFDRTLQQYIALNTASFSYTNSSTYICLARHVFRNSQKQIKVKNVVAQHSN